MSEPSWMDNPEDPEAPYVNDGLDPHFVYLDDGYMALSRTCAHCRHWTRPNGHWTCDAYPGPIKRLGGKAIPLAIWRGDNPHLLPYPGDHGIQFKAKSAQGSGT